MEAALRIQLKAAPVTLPSEFQQSLFNFESYPENLMLMNTLAYPSTLKTYKSRLDEAEEELFVNDEALVEVPYRDFDTASGEGLAVPQSYSRKLSEY